MADASISSGDPDTVSIAEDYSLPVRWRRASLVGVGAISGGSTPSTKIPAFWDGDIPWLTPNEVTRSASLFVDDTERHITNQGLANCSATLLPVGAVLMTSRATIGEVAINTVPMATNQGFINIVCNPSVVCNEFLAYWLRLHRPTLEARASGSTFREISKSSFKAVPIALPPLAEQRAIARVLRAVREAIAARRRELALERERKAALMARLFTHGTRGEPTTQTAIGDMPESWQVVRLGEVAAVSSGGTPERGRPEYWNGDIPWVKTGEINYGIITQTEERITQAGLENSSARLVPAGTLLMAMYGQGITRGRVAILGIDATLNQACAAIRTSREVVTAFLFHYLTYSYERIRNLGHGANQKNLNALLIKSITIPLLNREEQQDIADILAACDAKTVAVEREIALHEELFRALLEELMCGRLSAPPLVEVGDRGTAEADAMVKGIEGEAAG